jgi:hypothetical protein
MSSSDSAVLNAGMTRENPRAGPPLCTMADQSESGSRVVKLHSVKSGRGSAKTTVLAGAPVPSAPWQLAHAFRKISSPDRAVSCAPAGSAVSAAISDAAANAETVRGNTPPRSRIGPTVPLAL